MCYVPCTIHLRFHSIDKMSSIVTYCEKTKIISTPEDDFEAHPGGLGCALYEAMKEHSEKNAQIDGITEQTDSYSSFLERCIKTAIFMSKNGIKTTDVISICTHNHLNSSVPLIASLLIGSKIASLDPTMSKLELAYLIKLAEPKLLFVSEQCEELIEGAVEYSKCNTSLIVFGDSKRNKMFSAVLETELEDFKPKPCKNVMDTALIIFSSGTTGLPKGICLSHYMLQSSAIYRYAGIFTTFSSLYWSSTVLNIISVILKGGVRVACPPFNPKMAWDILQRCKVNAVFFSPSDLIQFYKERPVDEIDSIPLRVICIVGGYISHEYIQKIRKQFPKTSIIYTYGQTEILVAFNAMDPIVFSAPNCAGIPLPGRTYKIVDPETEEALSYNQSGELRIKTKFCMNGYYGQDSNNAWDSEGFLKTGDIAYYDEKYRFFVVDRIKEMFKYKGFHIVPAKLENILLDHPDVKFAAIVGIPHDEDDNHALAIIEPIENSKTTPEEIQKYFDDQVDDRHKLLAGVKFIKEMPFTPSNKIKRREIRDMFTDKL